MKKIIALTLMTAAISGTAFAGVAEKKAMRAADEALAAQAATTAQQCGNASLMVEVDWDGINAAIEANAAWLTEKRMDASNLINELSQRSVSTLEALAKICADDADYKAEIALLSKVSIKTKAEFSDYKSEFELAGEELVVYSGHYMTREANDFVARLKALY